MPQDTTPHQPHQSTQHHLATNSSNATAEPRKKRAKIMSACGECRRKKTKCNGEQPCRNCQKSNTACIYPAASQMDDKRNHGGPSKAALEAIEDRLKAIEDMLKTILQSQFPVHDLDPVAVNNFLIKSNDNNSSNYHNRLPSIHNLSAALPTDATTHASYHHHHHHHPHHPPSSSSSASSHHHHHGMVSPSTPNVNHLPPPIGLMQNEGYQQQQQHPLQQQHQRQEQHPSTIYQSQEQPHSLQPMKKRKR